MQSCLTSSPILARLNTIVMFSKKKKKKETHTLTTVAPYEEGLFPGCHPNHTFWFSSFCDHGDLAQARQILPANTRPATYHNLEALVCPWNTSDLNLE